jgi:hypothetical protein
MSTIQNLKIALKEALEREQALIEAFEEEIEAHFEGKHATRALGIFRNYINDYDSQGYIPSLSSMHKQIEEEQERAAEWRAKQEAAKPTPF